MATKKCVACGRHPSESVDEPAIPPLCRSCWDGAGEQIVVGAHVVCTADDSCNGIVDRFEDDLTIAVVRADDGNEAWVPTIELVRVIG
jgi:hypothetical protein